jgi:hypothetical protein
MVRAPTWQLNFGFSYAMPIAGDYNLLWLRLTIKSFN